MPMYGNAQPGDMPVSFPLAYYNLKSDTARMKFLVKSINDSLYGGQLHSVYALASKGLEMAIENHVDSMKGIFYFYIAKAFTYEYNKPDSAIFYYKKVFPYFNDKLSYYNLISVREIMIGFLHLDKKDSAFAYLDSLHNRLDTLSLTNPRRYSISSDMATVYEYYGMFKTAIALYKNSIDGKRKAGFPKSVGLPMANLAELYDESGDDTNAVKYAREALGYLAGNNMPYKGTASNLSVYYSNLNRIDSALFFNRQSDSVARLMHDDAQLYITNPLNYVDILCAEKKFEEAKKVLGSVKAWMEKLGDKADKVRYLISSATIDTGMHRLVPAAATLQKALKIAKASGQQVYIVLILQNLADVYSKLNNFPRAYQYQREFMLQKDSLTNDETKSRLADFDVMYKTQQKDESIALLKKNNDIKEIQLKNSRKMNGLYLGGFVFLLAATSIIFYQWNKRQKVQSQKTKAELQMQLLRSQMNPHFIFNSLNGIEYFILQNEKRQASVYLNKFASLIRIILINSRQDVVVFADDIQTIKLYIDLELLRFNHGFCYFTDIDQVLLDNDYRVPPLLIQPFVENAIIHGFGYSDKKNLILKIAVLQRGEYIVYTIEDNGVGRTKAGSFNAMNKPNHTSLGLQITKQRIDVFNEQHHSQSRVDIEDLYDANQQPAGTRVTVKVKSI